MSLNSVNMNLSRVIGPAIGGAIYAAYGISWVFIGNAFSYVFIIGALLLVQLPAVKRDPTAPTGLRRLLGGFVAAREDHVVGRCLLTMTIFSLFCLCFITQMPTLAQQQPRHRPEEHPVRPALRQLRPRRRDRRPVDRHLPLRPLARAHHPRRARRLRRRPHRFALVRTPIVAYPVALIVGFFYFGTVTSLATVLQVRLDERVRGRVMALWVMAFGGTVAIGALISGPPSRPRRSPS